MQNQITVTCDRCRAQGQPGNDPFESFGDLLRFTPVPRKQSRVDGWSPERQRAFIAALAVTGSPRRAAEAIDMAPYGADQLRKAAGSDSFNAAWDAAMAIAEERDASRLAAGVNAAIEAGAAKPRSGRRAPSSPPLDANEQQDAEKHALLETIFKRYLIKIGQERDMRLTGRIAAADFYLRQLTYIEVMLDLLSGDGLRILKEFRQGEHGLIEIAETPVSRALGEARRGKWAELGEPSGPEPTPQYLLIDHGRFSTEPNEFLRSDTGLSHEEQMRLLDERHRKAAIEQVEWEAQQRRDYDRRRASDAGS